jgi:hypothetical protein
MAECGMSHSIEKWFKNRGFNHADFTRKRSALHQADSHVSLNKYRSRLLHKFGQIVCQRTLVYLDLKYWVNLRKAMLKQPVHEQYVRLYDLLADGTSRGAIICPLSFWVFQELMKQSDPITRQATARLIDKFSQGVAFMPHGELACQELLHFIRKVSPKYRDTTQWPIRECIWTRTISFLPDRIPTWGDDIAQKDQLLVQKNYEDFHFFVPLEDVIVGAPFLPPELTGVGYNVGDINSRKLEVRRQHPSFRSIFFAELMHTIKENEPHLCEVIAYLYFIESGIEEEVSIEQIPEQERIAFRNVIWWGFKKGKITDELPSYQIPAALFAASCWDGPRQLSENDILDFYHAQVAIPYCDMFLTEASLKSTVCSQHLRLDSIYKTEVISHPGEAVQTIQRVAETTSGQDFQPLLAELFGQQ